MVNFIRMCLIGGYASSDGLSPEVAKMASLTASTYNGRMFLLLVFEQLAVNGGGFCI